MILNILALAALGAIQQPDTGLVQYEVAGLKVIHQRRPASTDIIAVSLYLLGGSRQLTADNAGIEPFYLSASAYGTAKYPGDATRKALARTGAQITFTTDADWTSYEFHGLKSDFDSTWSVFADRLLQPTLDDAAMKTVRARMLSAVARRHTSPEGLAWFLADSMASASHPYAVDPTGSEASLKAITAETLRAYAKEQFVTSRMLLVVVGDVQREQVERAVQRTLSTLPKGTYVWSLAEPWQPAKAAVVVVERSTSTNYIVGTMAGPPRNSPQFPAFVSAMGYLGGWVSYMVRERSGLSYSAGVMVQDRGAPSASIYVSTTNPDSAIKLVNFVLNAYEKEVMIPRSTLMASAKSLTAAYIHATESASGQAELLARAALYDGDPSAASRRAEVMKKIAFPNLRGSIHNYAKNIQYAFVGDTTLVPRKEMLKR